MRNINSALNSGVSLKMLADAGERGCTGANLFNHGFSIGMLADLVSYGLATGHRETVRIRITDAGRRALEG
jgi:hypothetical protein